jgi:hypothetical protein
VLYVIAGNGTGNTTEITKALSDLRDKAAKDQEDFWFLIEGKDSPTKTDDAILAWATKNDVWFEVVSSTGTTYDNAQDTTQADDVFEGFMTRISQRAEDNEGSAILALPVTEEGDTDDDELLMAFIETADGIGVETFLLNHEMIKIELSEEEVEEAPPAPAKKAAAKKAAAAKAPAKAASKSTKKAAAAAEEPEPEPEEAPTYTREELNKMGVPELSGLARGQGIDPKGLDKRSLITQILGMTEEAAAEPVKAAAKKAAAATAPDDGEVLVIVVPMSKVKALLS